MPRWSNDEHPPIPGEWLPDATPQEGSPEWEALLARVVAASEEAARAPTRVGAAPAPRAWPAVLGGWWRGAAVGAAAATALLLLVRPATIPPAAVDVGALPLTVVTAQGDPAALLEGLGIPADPVLALIAIEGGRP